MELRIDGTKIYSSILEMGLMMMIIHLAVGGGLTCCIGLKPRGFCGLTYVITTIKKILCGHFWLFTKLYVFQTRGGEEAGDEVRF